VQDSSLESPPHSLSDYPPHSQIDYEVETDDLKVQIDYEVEAQDLSDYSLSDYQAAAMCKIQIIFQKKLASEIAGKFEKIPFALLQKRPGDLGSLFRE